MKEQNKQILALLQLLPFDKDQILDAFSVYQMYVDHNDVLLNLQSFSADEVLKAYELYKDGIDNNFISAKEELITGGWLSQDEKPTDREFYLFEGKFWCQSDKVRQEWVDSVMAQRKKEQTEAPKPKKKSSADLNKTAMKCPKCNGSMYKQAVCGGCKEGKQGFKLRLICEENPDHEVLL